MIALSLLSLSCVAWFYAQHLSIARRERHDALMALYHKRLASMERDWRKS